ncbi:MAG: spore germination protein [Clostridiales bacterium]|nr:spore germination protein [Clostridiales bacterium]
MKKELKQNIAYIKTRLRNSNELIVKEISTPHSGMAVLYMVGLNNTEMLSHFVIEPLSKYTEKVTSLTTLTTSVITLSETTEEGDNNQIISAILKGKAILLIDKFDKAIILAVDSFKERAIAEPPTSTVLKGPRAGFVENYKTNISILRKILATPKLHTDSIVVGQYTETQISIVYIEGIVDMEIVDTVKRKIEAIDIDGILDSFYVSSYLEERKNSMFRQVGNSEKPDVIASKLLEGRVAIIVDGSPMVITVPFIYMEDIQSGDDYYSNHSRATFVRWIRIMAIFITLVAPALYIAVVLHHNKAIPLKFLISIVNSTKGLPLTPFAEILFVLLLFEILYEASVRMPKYLGLALSIVGALILGDTAVKAGLISPPAVMIVAISGLTIYCVPEQAPQLYLLRMLFTLAGGFLGFYGITALMLFLVLYLCDFDSYKSAYLAPIAPFVEDDIKDILYKTDITNMDTRPLSISNNRKNLKRKGK